MQGLRPKLYLAALAGMALFGLIVVIDVSRPGLLASNLALGASLALAACGIAVIILRPRAKRLRPHDAAPDFKTMIEERRRLAEDAARSGRRLPPGDE